MTRTTCLHILGIAAVFVTACTGARDTELDDQVSNAAQPTESTEPGATGDGDDPVAADQGEPSGTSSSGGTTSSGGSTSSSGGATGTCKFKDAIDHDGDGLSWMDGDCNDCDASIRPGKVDEPGNGKDEDCSGKADDDLACDGSLTLASSDAMDGARALGVCNSAVATKPGWGIISAKYVMPDGTPLSHAASHGILPSFGGNQPQTGKAMLALSTGTARAPNQPEYVAQLDKGYSHGTPAGWPKTSPSCIGANQVAPSATAKDGAALELKIKVPVDANSMSFEHSLFSKDYSAYVCSQYTDQFVVIMSPAPAGAVDGNIVFDSLGGSVGVNSPLLQACAGGTFKGITYACGLGGTSLTGTGFEGHASTGWLRTTTPVEPGSTITLLFAVWDSGDGTYDTTVLLDSLRFWTKTVTKTQTVPK